MLNLVRKHQEMTKKVMDDLPESPPSVMWFSRIATIVLFVIVVYILRQNHVSTV